MITEAQRQTFLDRGVARLAGLLSPEVVAPARDAVRRVLERRGLWRDGSWSLGDRDASGSVRAGADLVRGVNASQSFRALMTTEVREAAVALVGGSVFVLTEKPQLLLTLPNAERWTVPHGMWHLDLPRLGLDVTPGVQLFTFLDRVEPGGGGTLVVAGSHRLLNTGQQIRSKTVKRRLRREPYFRELMSKHTNDRLRFLREPGHAGETAVQVVELHGRPGDVYLVDMRVLHTIAPNASAVPRMMVTQRFVSTALRSEIEQVYRADVAATERTRQDDG